MQGSCLFWLGKSMNRRLTNCRALISYNLSLNSIKCLNILTVTNRRLDWPATCLEGNRREYSMLDKQTLGKEEGVQYVCMCMYA